MGDRAPSVVSRGPGIRTQARYGVVILLPVVMALGASVTSHAAFAHPLHTTLTQVVQDSRRGVAIGSIRVFAGDLATAVAKRDGAAPPNDDRVSDSAAFAYVVATVRLRDAAGRPIRLEWCGSRRSADLLWLCVRAATGATLRSLTISDQMLCELFDDQVNIVQSVDGESTGSVLFTKGEGAKRLL